MLLFCLMIFFNASAQYSKSPGYHKRDGKIAAIGVHVGYYRPIVYYYNNIYLENADLRLDGGIAFGGTIDYYLSNGFYLRAGLDVSGQTLEVNDVLFRDVSRDDEFSLRSIHGSLVIYKEMDFKIGLKPYVGLGVGIMRGEVDHSISYEDLDTAYVNIGYPGYGIAVGGVNYMLTEAIDLGMELRLYWPAHHGSYNTVDLGGAPTVLSYAGPSGFVRLAYRFDAFSNRDRLDVRRRRMKSARRR